MRIAFHTNQLGLRGTEVSVYQYAHYSEVLLGHAAFILTPRESPGSHADGVTRFSSRFPVCYYDDPVEIDAILSREGADLLYAQKAGCRDGIESKRVRTVVHSVFSYFEPHGDVYAYISEWLSLHASGGKRPFVPYMVDLPRATGDLRSELGIPLDAVVFGRHGGLDSFNIDFARSAVRDVARRRQDRIFLFMNTDRFCETLPNIIHLDGSADPIYKSRFINSCDAMLHAQELGESFGLAVAEFSSHDKPVLTWYGSPQKAHLRMLGEKCLPYRNHEGLCRLLETFEPDGTRSWNAYEGFAPEPVMEQFRTVFLSSGVQRRRR